MAEKLLEIKNLKQYFNVGKKNEVRAVDDITFDIYKGETLGLSGNLVVVNQQLVVQLSVFTMQQVGKSFMMVSMSMRKNRKQN